MYDKITWEQALEGCKHVACIPVSNFSVPDIFKIAYIASENGATINTFVFARDVKNIEETSNIYLENLERGIIEEDFAYVLKKGNEEQAKLSNLKYSVIEDYIVITSKSH